MKKSIFAEGMEPEEVCPPPLCYFLVVPHSGQIYVDVDQRVRHVRPGVNQETLSSWPGCPSITVDLRSCHTHTHTRAAATAVR